MPQIAFLKEGKPSIRFPLKRQQVTIGRSPDCEITLEGPQVSRLHALIHYKEGYYQLADQSKNGTIINDQSVAQARLQNGDLIVIGEWKLQFLEDSPSQNRETVTAAQSSQKTPRTRGSQEFAGMIGASSKTKEIFRLIEKVAPSSATILILGETGTGKELIANAVHQLSKRALMPLIAVNCAAISANLIESELFGHERGAFTGALQAHRGSFEQAEGGTLFLDEIGELSYDLQSKLLRTLEVQKIRRVGGSAEISVKCRIVAATHRDLVREVKEGRFREDLYYRLFVMPIEVPPLRQRREEIPVLARHFLSQMRPDQPPEISDEAMGKLKEHLWPGNIRELKNVILRAALLSENETVEPQQIVFLPHTVTDHSPEPQNLQEMEKGIILKKLKETNWNKAAAARDLGIATSTIFKKIKEYGLTKG